MRLAFESSAGARQPISPRLQGKCQTIIECCHDIVTRLLHQCGFVVIPARVSDAREESRSQRLGGQKNRDSSRGSHARE
jgi:hypothetical protein